MLSQEKIYLFNLFTDFSFLNKNANDPFLKQKAMMSVYQDKDIICNGSQQDDDALYIIGSGAVRVIRPLLNTNDVLYYTLKEGCIFGVETVLSPSYGTPIIVSAINTVEVYKIYKTDILRQCQDINVMNGLFRAYIQTMNYAMMCR